MKKYLLLFFFAFSFGSSLLGQGEIDEQRHVLFRDESSFAVNLNSNGFGLNYRRGFYRDVKNQFLLDLDFNYVKHQKEVKSEVPYEYSTRRYVYGKENLFWDLKFGAGWQKELFRKYDKSGISVRLYYGGGASLGFLKPIYYEVLDLGSIGSVVSTSYEKFDPSLHQSNIGGRGPFFKGFDELKVVPGAFAKAGMSFEYSKKDAVIHALEAGISLTVYPYEIPIMAVEDNDFLFFNLFIGYRFGRIIDISEAARAKSRKQKRKERRSASGSKQSTVF